jgi:short-subunit dehydrogenase
MTGMVVVITGATAGVGRATALAFARRGAKLGLIARDEAALEDTRAEVAALGAEAETASLDVADAEAVARAADAFENSLGPIDVWVNNAMVTIFSSVEDLTAEEIARVTDVTYLGTVHGTLAALKHMRPRNRGVIVQVGSSLAYRGIPLQAAYCAAKHAVRGFTDSLRVELRQAHSNIHVTAVHLPAINTPQFDWARTRRQKQPRPVAPVFTPEAAAEAIVHAAEHLQREHWLGGMTPVTILANAVFPGLIGPHPGCPGHRRAADGATGRPGPQGQSLRTRPREASDGGPLRRRGEAECLAVPRAAHPGRGPRRRLPPGRAGGPDARVHAVLRARSPQAGR